MTVLFRFETEKEDPRDIRLALPLFPCLRSLQEQPRRKCSHVVEFMGRIHAFIPTQFSAAFKLLMMWLCIVVIICFLSSAMSDRHVTKILFIVIIAGLNSSPEIANGIFGPPRESQRLLSWTSLQKCTSTSCAKNSRENLVDVFMRLRDRSMS